MNTSEEEVKETSYEDSFQACCHTITFWYTGEHDITDELKERLKEAAEERARECLAQDYREGELNYEEENIQFTGWWRINND